jgi:RimJ/RimL family protein N-acetyltransferase
MRPATLDDVPFVMATERLEANALRISRWDAERHGSALADPDFAYRIALDVQAAPVGFAILCGLTDRHGNVCLQRLAVGRPGQGVGRAFLRAVIDEMFETTACHRFWLDVFADNAGARRLYGSLGLTEEGVLRETIVRADGNRADQAVMSVLRTEWLAARR